MLIYRIRKSLSTSYANPRIIFSTDVRELKKLESRLTIQAFQLFQVKTCESYKSGFISCWHFPKGLASQFETAYLNAIHHKTIIGANNEHRVKERERKEKERLARIARRLKEEKSKVLATKKHVERKATLEYWREYSYQRRKRLKKEATAETKAKRPRRESLTALLEAKVAKTRPITLLASLPDTE